MIEAAETVYLLAVSSKIGKTQFSFVLYRKMTVASELITVRWKPENQSHNSLMTS